MPEREPHTEEFNARHTDGGVTPSRLKLYDITTSNICELKESIHWLNCKSSAESPVKEFEELTLTVRCERTT